MAGILIPQKCCCGNCSDGSCPANFLAITFAGLTACGASCDSCTTSSGSVGSLRVVNPGNINGYTFNVPLTGGFGTIRTYSGVLYANGTQAGTANASCVPQTTYEHLEFLIQISSCTISMRVRFSPEAGWPVSNVNGCINVFMIPSVPTTTFSGCAFNLPNGNASCPAVNSAFAGGSASGVFI